ncbi:MAG: winged helix-turn-helix domain-containing protein [Deltaproteobacteria bacterium]|nr:winged helix-turn-helix domain-containing protein [Deltaproteobacteria bacterium]
MTENSAEKDAKKEAMKALRKARKQEIAAATAKMKEQKKVIKAIKEALGAEGATVPTVVEQTGMPSAEVFWYLATMKKYGEIVEGEKDGAYFRYKLVAEETPQEEAAQEG